MLNAKLVVVGGDAKKAEVQLKLPLVIGRGKEAGLTVPHALVSRRHTEIFERKGRLFVRDLGSLNGTYVNNTRIEGEQPLEPNQLLTLGNITFRAVYEIESYSPVSAAEGTETVSLDNNKTDVLQIQSPDGKSQMSSISDMMSFDETVPVDSMASNGKPVDQSNPESRPDARRENVEQPVPAHQKNPVKKTTDPLLFNDDDLSDKPSAGETDKSLVDGTTCDGDTFGSSFFSFETETVDPASKSISLSALDNLPAGQSAVSVFEDVETGDDLKKPVSKLDPVDINLGPDDSKAEIEADSKLGSFLKKLPR